MDFCQTVERLPQIAIISITSSGKRLATGLKLYPLILTAGVVDFAFLQMSTSLQRMTKANAGKYKTLFFEKNFSLRELDKTSDNELLTVSFIGQ